jgi:hypothetical protein
MALALLASIFVAAAGWALILTWLFGGGIGMFILLFIILKMIGK